MTLKTAMVNDTIFLQGKYLSLALGEQGAIGTYEDVPAGFNAFKGENVTNVGLYADLDGFGTGSASKMQDVVAMGAIIERFNIGYNINGTQYIEGSTQFGTTTMTGESSNLSDATTGRAGWVGTTDEDLKVEQVVTLTDDGKYVRFDITLTNESGKTMTDLRYMRSMDPDQDVSYKNKITVVEQGGDGADGALITAAQVNGTNPVFYYTADDRAKVSTYALINRNPYDTRAHTTAVAEGYSVTADQSINLTFDAGTLAAGKSTTLTFYMGITDNLAATLAEIKAQDDAPTTPTPVDLAPVAAADSFSTAFGILATGNVLANDSDPEGKALTANLASSTVNGTLKLLSNGTFTYVPKAGFAGTDSFTYTASDGTSSSTAKVTITVAKPNGPVATADVASVTSGASVTGNVLSNDTAATGVTLKSSLVNGPANGTLSLGADGKYVYTAKAGFVGTDSFTYAATDGFSTSQAKVTLTVAAKPNTTPVAANDDAGEVEAGLSVSGNVLANDTDADGDALTAILVNGPSHGTVKLNSNGTYVYTADAGYEGADSFTYKASDGKATEGATVSIEVTAPAVTLSPLEKLLAAHDAVDGSAAASQTLTGAAGHNAFYFEKAAVTGTDTITNFGGSDVLIFSQALLDGNRDNIITFSGGKLRVDGTTTGDALILSGDTSLRYLGEAVDGAHVYANGSVKPKSALESRFSDDTLAGDSKDSKVQKFFFDTALGFDLGNDKITKMGAKDILVTTTAINDANGDGIVGVGSDGKLHLTGIDGLNDEAALVSITNVSGQAVTGLEFDGSVLHDGVTYYVYSTIGSAAGIAALGF